MASNRSFFLLVMLLCKLAAQKTVSAESCKSGYEEDDGHCEDVDECDTSTSKCDPGATCVNTIGSYCCAANDSLPNKCSGCKNYSHKENGTNSNTISDQVCRNLGHLRDHFQHLRLILEHRADHQPFKTKEIMERIENALMSSIEASSTQGEERILMADFELAIRHLPRREAGNLHSEILQLSTMGNTMEFNSTAFTRMQSDGRTPGVALITYKTMESILLINYEMAEEEKEFNEQRMVLNSKILTVVMSSSWREYLTHPIIFTFNHIESNKNMSYITCVYWNLTEKGSFWSPEGCELVMHNRTHTVCRVSHLSSFAVLMALKDLPEVFAVDIITYVGLSISLVCLFLAIVTFTTCHPLKDTRCTIHINLCLSLFVSDFVFLFGISQTGNRILCGIIAAVLHYSFLSVFGWMLLEGIQLYLMVEVVFVSKFPLERYIYWIGYGLPALIVAVSAAVYHNGYGTPSSCWLNFKNCFVCSFVVPVVIISAVNLFFFCKALIKQKVVMSKTGSDGSGAEKRAFTLTAIGQWVILGCGWILGGFYIQKTTIPMMYIFTILNSFQGMFIFIMHCLMYKKVREAYAHCLGRAACLRSSKHIPVTTSGPQTASSQE
ncbi:adhesion G protein-coupled receptor E4-like isoform X2 [Heterodontus francisci]|uniref:adhesion G protein-coupled receptor E4-like isoform X2 n=1 Tax=Heterodontus francisci TaxID=7792 RepID=UPI00355AED03